VPALKYFVAPEKSSEKMMSPADGDGKVPAADGEGTTVEVGADVGTWVAAWLGAAVGV
jgi:hypothetical protein